MRCTKQRPRQIDEEDADSLTLRATVILHVTVEGDALRCFAQVDAVLAQLLLVAVAPAALEAVQHDVAWLASREARGDVHVRLTHGGPELESAHHISELVIWEIDCVPRQRGATSGVPCSPSEPREILVDDDGNIEDKYDSVASVEESMRRAAAEFFLDNYSAPEEQQRITAGNYYLSAVAMPPPRTSSTAHSLGAPGRSYYPGFC